jgi:hypothetical protein
VVRSIEKDGVVMERTRHGWAGVLPGIDEEIARALGQPEPVADEATEVATPHPRSEVSL